jgi:hypothetical protein
MNYIYRLLLISSSLSITLAVYFINKKISILSQAVMWLRDNTDFFHQFVYNFYAFNMASYFLYILGCLAISSVGLSFSKRLSVETVSKGSFKTFELVNDTFIPIYLAYFFIALSVGNLVTFSIIFSIVFVFVYASSSVCFDPLYVLRGYKIYAAVSNADVKNYIITKQIIKDASAVEFSTLHRINNFTFIEIGGSDAPYSSEA